MLNFNLQPCEWQNNMNILMQNVNLNKIEFSNSNSIRFSFSNSCDGNSYKNLLCTNVWKFTEDNNLCGGDTFPIFICDVRALELESSEIKEAFGCLGYKFGDIPNGSEYNLVCLDSGEISIALICETLSVA